MRLLKHGPRFTKVQILLEDKNVIMIMLISAQDQKESDLTKKFVKLICLS